MTTGPHADAAFIQENQNKVEHSDSHAALFYLFQEVSKLASPIHDSFLDTNPPNRSLNETSRKDPFLFNKEEENGHSFQVSLSSFQKSVSSKWGENKNVREECQDSTTVALDETVHECNSPWKVLSLINLHCEKLLNQRDDQELSSSSVISYTDYEHSPAEPGVTEGGVGKDSVKLTVRSPLLCDSFSLEDSIGHHPEDGYKLQCCVKNTEGSFSLQPQTAEKTASLDPQQTFRVEVKFSARQLEQSSSTENGTLDQTQIPKTASPLTFSSNDEEFKDMSKLDLAVDHNANFTLTTELLCDTQPPSLSTTLLASGSASLAFNTTDNSDSKQDDKLTSQRPDCTPTPVKEKQKSSSCGASSGSSGPELCPFKKEESGLPSSHQWRTKTQRKQPHPSRSANIQDPHFQGVTFRMDTELDDTREQCRLLITSKYSKELCKSVRRPRLRTRTSQKSIRASSSDDEPDITNNVIKGKICASCCTRKTPMWRDAEDGTPLCNACGIRYKKYRVRCVNCWHIPRKDDNSNSRCLKCGNFARQTSAHRKHTT